jgi:hypothetical protein
VGTTDTDWQGDLANPAAEESDIDYLIGQANRWLTRPLRREDVIGVYAGLRPLVSDGNTDDATTTLSREHAIFRPVPGLVQIAGGKDCCSFANAPPIANAGKYQNVVKGSTVTLDGSNSTDQNGDTLTYIWALVSQPVSLTSEVKLSLNDPIKPTFTATAAGTYVFSLKVSDGTLESPLQYVTITAGEANVEPDAKLAQSAITTRIGSKVVLDGSSSTDANGDTIIFRWTLISQPTNSVVALTGSGTYNPFFTPTHAGFYVVSLVASDGRLDSKPVVVVVTVTP